jgi:hypothetical protein
MIRKCLPVFGLALVALLGGASAARAEAPAPGGVWYGTFSDGSGSMSVVYKGNSTGGFVVRNAGGRVLRGQTGWWGWNGNSTGGVLTLTYYQVGLESHIYFSITYLDANHIRLKDPVAGVSIILRRL